MRDRADKVLVKLGLVSSRSQARLLVEEGVVYASGKQLSKAGQLIDDTDVEVRKETLYVGRGAHKIEGALDKFAVDPNGMVVADVGASTGGFTDFVLKRGAKRVFAIDVGHDQLAKSLCEDPRVVNLEGTNIRFPLELDELVDLAVVDLSYISLRLTLETIFSLVKEGGEVICLVKPQFEAGKGRIGRGGIVRDEVRPEVVEELYDWCQENGYGVSDAMRSPITGKSGNIEYFFYFKKGDTSPMFDKELLRHI